MFNTKINGENSAENDFFVKFEDDLERVLNRKPATGKAKSFLARLFSSKYLILIAVAAALIYFLLFGFILNMMDLR